MKQIGAVKKPTFFWQGVLILLPVLVLSVLGIYSLKLERQRAEQEAIEQAQRFAEEFADLYERELTNSAGQEAIVLEMDSAFNLLSPPPLAPVPEPHPLDTISLTTEQSGLWQKATRFKKNGVVKEILSTNEIWAWQQFLASKPPVNFAAIAWYNLGLAYETYAEQEFAGKLRLESSEFIGPITPPTICICPEAAGAFSQIIEHYQDELGETGLPLLPLAQLHWNKTADISQVQRESNLVLLASNTVAHPSILTTELLQELENLESPQPGGVKDTMRVSSAPQPKKLKSRWFATNEVQKQLPVRYYYGPTWDNQETARQLYEKFRIYASSNSGKWGRFFWLQEGPGNSPDTNMPWLISWQFDRPVGWTLMDSVDYNWPWLAHARLTDNNRFKVVLFKEQHPGWFDLTPSLLKRLPLPNYADIYLEVAGRSVCYVHPRPPISGPGFIKVEMNNAKSLNEFKSLAIATRSENNQEYLRVKVQLVAPAMLYQQIRARAEWLGWLIAAASLAAFIGWFAAWRAFQRQHQLAVMKTNFVSSVSHELRAPIASVRLLAEGLERGKIQEESKQHEYFRLIVQECRRLSSLVENVLDFSRIEQGRKEYEFEPTDLKALVEQTVRLMEPAAEERQVHLERHLPNEAVTAEVDGRALQQALVNLMDNALKHSPKDSTIQINLESAINHQQSTINLSVQDHGPGIPPEDYERIFERFYRRGSELRRETQGVGIGLSIVKHIVEAHGGRVLVDSAVGKGSRFTISLPMKS